MLTGLACTHFVENANFMRIWSLLCCNSLGSGLSKLRALGAEDRNWIKVGPDPGHLLIRVSNLRPHTLYSITPSFMGSSPIEGVKTKLLDSRSPIPASIKLRKVTSSSDGLTPFNLLMSSVSGNFLTNRSPHGLSVRINIRKFPGSYFSRGPTGRYTTSPRSPPGSGPCRPMLRRV